MANAISSVIHERDREIVPGQHVGRVLPTPPLMHVGPFVFLDHGRPRNLRRVKGATSLPTRTSASRR